jgi:hypothetical protein
MRQRDFFNVAENQYSQELVVRPPQHTLNEIEAVIGRLRQQPGIRSVVDFGAGSGRLTVPFLRHGFSVLAVDVSDRSLESLKNLVERLSLPSPATAPAVTDQIRCGRRNRHPPSHRSRRASSIAICRPPRPGAGGLLRARWLQPDVVRLSTSHRALAHREGGAALHLSQPEEEVLRRMASTMSAFPALASCPDRSSTGPSGSVG